MLELLEFELCWYWSVDACNVLSQLAVSEVSALRLRSRLTALTQN
jgi:hypothetical protein